MVEKFLVVSDTIEGTQISSKEFHNEIQSLHSLFEGLAFLDGQMAFCERAAAQSQNGTTIVGFFSNIEQDFGLPPGSNSLLPCFYHWFGTSAVNFARLFGFLKGMSQGDLPHPPHSSNALKTTVKNYCSNYVASVSEIAEAHIWRNKVFAHFSNTDPRPSDSDQLLNNTLFYPISYMQGKFVVGGFQVFQGPFEGPFDPATGTLPMRAPDSGLPPWSLTEVFEKMRNRFSFDWRGEA